MIIVLCARKYCFSPEAIAEILNLPVETVTEILENLSHNDR
ncbi:MULTISPECIES: hypothetical protein [unclassified Roseofilum]|nr:MULTISPECIES: hypothetical protein [unclassified Roseofilum]